MCGAARTAGRAAHAKRGQGRGDRQRTRGQDTGHAHGDQAAADARPATARRRGGRACAGHLSSVAWRRAGQARGRGSRSRRSGSPMIAHLEGVVTMVAPEGAVIDVGGVGLLVQCSPGTLARLRPGERAKVSTSLVVREEALTLYGFSSDDERNTFELLQTASGIGPRLALAMLATFNPDGLRRAVAAEDVTALTSVPGIGRKGAQRIVLELAGRLGSPGDNVLGGQEPGATGAAGA